MSQEKTVFNYAKELKAIAKGSKKSLQSLYEQEASYMLAFAFKVLHHYKFAEDAVVETFNIIWNNAKYFDENMNHPRGWIYAIFRYHLNGIIRKNYQALKENKKENPVLGDVCTNLHAGVHTFMEPGSFYQVFEELPEETQKVLITTYFSAESLADTATLLEMPLGRLKENILLGLRHLSQKREPLSFKHDHTVFIGEFVLGSLTDSEQQKANTLLSEDPIAENISFVWEEEFLNFTNQLILEKTPESLWVRIKQATVAAEKNTNTDNQELEDELQLSQDQSNAVGFFDKLMITLRKCWISRNFWRAASLALLGVIAALLIIRPLENPIRVAAVLNSATQLNQVGFTVKQDNKLTITPIVQQTLGEQLRLQLWHRDNQGFTRALGIVNSDKDTVLAANSQLKTGDLLLISLEPVSPNLADSITGQILYQGTVGEF